MMGTTYGIWQGDGSEISIDEMSNKLQLFINNVMGEEVYTEKMEPEQMINAALEILKVCSYWTGEGTVEKAIADFKAKGYHW